MCRISSGNLVAIKMSCRGIAMPLTGKAFMCYHGTWNRFPITAFSIFLYEQRSFHRLLGANSFIIETVIYNMWEMAFNPHRLTDSMKMYDAGKWICCPFMLVFGTYTGLQVGHHCACRCLNTLRAKWNDHRIADDISKWILAIETVWISIKNS